MSITSLRIPGELKQRAARAAQELGIITPAFMIDAIRQAAEAVETRSPFIAQAQTARAEMLQSGLGYDANEIRSYLHQRISNKLAQQPEAKPWRPGSGPNGEAKS